MKLMADQEFFEKSVEPPPEGKQHFLSEAEPVGIDPLYLSDIAGAEAQRHVFIRGAKALGLNTARKKIQPQQFTIADALNAETEPGIPTWSVIGICVPRRASKSTSIFAVALGRCLEYEDYQVSYTAQSGTKARDRFLKDLVLPLERAFPDEDARPFKINRSRGGEHIRFTNGSLLQVAPPLPDSFRGDAFDMVILDEAQVHEPQISEDLLGAILPVFDTRPGAQLVVAGTAGEHRSGVLWDTLQRGRAGKAGIVEYAAPAETPIYDPDVDESVDGTTADPETWKLAHPGIGNLTPLSAVQRNYEALPRAQFNREYLGLWPEGGTSNFINADKWEKCRIPGALPAIPKQFSLALSVHPEQRAASICAAWRDDAGLAHVLLLDHRPGTKWVPQVLATLANKYKTPVIFDKGSSTASVEIEQLSRATPKPRTDPQVWHNVSVAAALIVKAIDSQTLRHHDQPAMNDAAEWATKRGTPNSSKWALGRAEAGQDITPLEAASLALRVFDESSGKTRILPPPEM